MTLQDLKQANFQVFAQKTEIINKTTSDYICVHVIINS